MLSEPLSLLILLAALALAVLAPAFHFHQFGDPMRMARDAGFSALFTCGTALAVFGVLRSVRREVESGTLDMALAHPVSRRQFFLGKVVGAFLAVIVFLTIVFGTLALICEGAIVGANVARRTGDISRVFGPFLAGGMAIIVLPLVLAAALNRFARCRFVHAAFRIALVMAVGFAVVVGFLNPNLLSRLAPVAVLLSFPVLFMLVTAAALSVRFKANVTASIAGVAFVMAFPAIGNYYLVEALANDGSVSWGYVMLAALCAVPAVSVPLLAGFKFIEAHE